MAEYNRNRPWIIRIFSGKNPFIFAIIALAFIFLYVYRLNDPLVIGSKIQDFKLTTINGETFNISEIKMPVVLVFYKKHTFFSNYMFNYHYRKLLPQLAFLQDNNYAQVVVIVDGYDTKEELLQLSKDKNHTVLSKIGYVADTKTVAKSFGVRSWPHLFLISSNGVVLYEAKLTGVDYIRDLLWRN